MGNSLLIVEIDKNVQLHSDWLHVEWSRPRTVYLDNIFRYIDKLVDEALPVDFGEDASLVVIPQRTTHRLVVHVRFIFVQTP